MSHCSICWFRIVIASIALLTGNCASSSSCMRNTDCVKGASCVAGECVIPQPTASPNANDASVDTSDAN